ncbi:MAG: translation elongation factor Ts [Candidatus Omnitrophica bacterium]|nr:translation elongation factor Ts [Candidatus Omnitrophota bacterium]
MLDTIKDLRERTGAGIMDCKAALAASGNDIEKAVDFLRKKGMAQAAKRVGREAKEGLVGSRIDGKRAAIVEVNCETDFVARTDEFQDLLRLVLSETLASGEAALTAAKVTDRVAELSGKIGEKIVAKRAKLLEAKSGTLFTYIHANNKLGILVELSLNDAALGKNIAMQIAASNPLCITRAEVPPAALEREKAIYREEIKGKPENIVEKILQGKLEKFYQNSCLLEQPYIKDDKMTVKQVLAGAEVKQFVRFQLGEASAA